MTFALPLWQTVPTQRFVFVFPERARKLMAAAVSLGPLFLPRILSHIGQMHILWVSSQLAQELGVRWTEECPEAPTLLARDFPAPGLLLGLLIQSKMITLQCVPSARTPFKGFPQWSLRGSGGWSSVCPLFSSPFFSTPHFLSLIFLGLG